MSLMTQCPSCAIVFKVVPDQLRISDGWVRCGQCNVVFDANANLQSDASSAVSAAPVTQGHEQAQASVWQGNSNRSDNIHEDDGNAVKLQLFHLSQTGHVVEEETVLAVEPEDTAPSFSALPNQVKQAKQASKFSVSIPGLQPRMSPKHTEGAPTRLPDLDLKHSFLSKPVSRPSMWRDMGAIWGIAVFLLGMLLLLQIVVQQRDKLAAAKPELQPALTSLCTLMHCKLDTLRQIESVVIDSSSFTNLRADIYRLGVTFKNTAFVDVALPALELTLTDTQDRSVLRRVFTPEDLGLAQKVVPAGAELSATAIMSVSPVGAQARVSGYRLVIFYPQ